MTSLRDHRLVLCAVLLAVLPVACAGKGGHGGFQMPPLPVEVADVQDETVRDQFRALGTLEAREIVKVVNELNAVVRQMPFTEGQSVARGTLLARLDDSEIKAEAQRTDALRDQAQVNYKRIQRLTEQQAASPQELDDASAALKVAEANYQVAKARLDKTVIRSPLVGVVGRRLVSPGAFLREGDAITEVASVDLMKLTFAAPERYVGQLHLGAPVSVTTTAYPGMTFGGRVTVVDPILDPNTRTVQLVAEVPNKGRHLRAGMSANVSAVLAERPHALTIPDEAIFSQGDQNFVYVVKPDSTVARQAITIGARDSAKVEISSGLKAGDRVVAAGHQKLFDGAKVVPVPPGGMAMGGPGGPGGAPGGAGQKGGGGGAKAAGGDKAASKSKGGGKAGGGTR